VPSIVTEAPTGFVSLTSFFKSEIIKIIEPLLLQNNLTLEVKKAIDNNKVVSVEGT
jgi:hypothetical protein